MVYDVYGYMYFADRIGDTYRWKGENVATIEVENAVSKNLNSIEVVVYGVEIVGQEGRKIYCRAEGRIGSSEGVVAVEAAAIFIVVPMEHFISNAPEGFRDVLAGRTDLSIDTEFEINP